MKNKIETMGTPPELLRQIVPTIEGGILQKRFLQGNEAIAEGVLEAGVRFYAGYPITPSTEIAEILSARLPRVRGTFIQMEDEIASMGAVLGASLAGVKSITATSGPGFSLMQELIGYAGMAQIPCVIIDVMRAGPSTGMPTSSAQGDVMQAIWGTHGDHPVVVVTPGSVSEAYYLAIWCVNIAERLRIPVIFLPDEVIGHMRELLLVPPSELIHREERPRPLPGEHRGAQPFSVNGIEVPPMAPLGSGFRYNVTGLVHDEMGFPTNNPGRGEQLISFLIDKVVQRTEELSFAEEFETSDAEVIIIAYGGTARSARHSVRELRAAGYRAGLFRIITLHPFPHKQLAELGRTCSRFLLVEMNRGQLNLTVRASIGIQAQLATINRSNGILISPAEINVAARLLQSGESGPSREAMAA